jgi:hypothetical protein
VEQKAILSIQSADMLLFSMSCANPGPASLLGTSLRALLGLLLGFALLAAMSASQEFPVVSRAPETRDLFTLVITNEKNSETILGQFERTERVEKRKIGGDQDPVETRTTRHFPVGTGVDKIALSPDGQPADRESYRIDLEKLEKYLVWVAQDGAAQKEAYARTERRLKERYELIEATHHAFLFTFVGNETREDRTLLRYTMAPNPAYQPTSRNTILFTKVTGTVWVDERSSELAKIEGRVTEDVSIALFLAKVYQGSHFMQERYEIAPGVWEPTYEQFDFEGRKYLMPFSIHERTFYTNYKRVGPPREAVEVVRAELSKLRTEQPAR